jgi:hypothetical protein
MTNIYEHQAAQRLRIVSCYSNALDSFKKSEEVKPVEENKPEAQEGKEENKEENK